MPGVRTRRRRALLGIGVLIACAASGAGGHGAGAQQALPPNFVVIMADDQGRGMMRALRATRTLLGKSGTSFTSALASYPLCCPARATFLTGQYAHNHGAKGNSPKSGGGYGALIDPEKNLAAWLQASGYDTAFAGKWLNGLRTPRRAPPGWSEWRGLVGAGGESLSSYYDYDVFDPAGEPRHYGTSRLDYQTDALTRDYVLPFIAGHAGSTSPFFLWVAYHPPHNGLGRDDRASRRCSDGPPDSRRGKQSAIPAPSDARAFLDTPPPRPPSFDERDLSDKPPFLRRKPRLSDDDLERIKRDYRCGLAALLSLDRAVADIVATVRGIGQLDNTVIAFTADHGVLGGEHRIKRGKNRPYEESISIPLLIRGPGIARNATVSAPVANADLAPTLLDYAGATVPSELSRPIDGVSLAPVLAGAGDDARRVIPIEGRSNTARARRGFKVRSYVGVRTARYAYTEYRRASYDTMREGVAAPIGAGRVTDVELYDLRRDPFELENAAARPVYRAARRELARLTAQLEQCSAEDCFVRARVPVP
jgi:arylsulfatase A-like enzyme